MAGPSVAVKVLADLKGLSGSFDGAAKTAQTATSRIGGAFKSMLGTLNQTGVLGGFGEAIAGIDEAIGKVIEHGKKIGPSLQAGGAAALGAGAGLTAIGSKDQAAHQQLQQAIADTGGSYEDYSKKVEAAVKSQEKYGRTANQTEDALTALTQATHDPAKALDLLNEASDVAAAKHESLTSAATAVGKVYNGNTKLLKEFGIQIDKTTGKTKDGQTATQALADVVKGQAAAATDTFTGKLDAVKAKIEDLTAQFGQKYGPAIQAAGVAMLALGSIWETASAIMAAAEAIPLAPILLIVLAVAGLIAIGYVLYRNWGTIWGFLKRIIEDVWVWIKANWPLLLGILLGPIALAAALIYKYWDQIKGAAVAVFNWFRTAWRTVTGYITAPVLTAIGAIERAFNTVVGFFTGLPATIGAVFADVGNAIAGAFKDAFNLVAGFWNDTIGSLSFHFPSWLSHLPGGGLIAGKGFDMPNIPTLAQGGLITQTGIVFAHAGEVISPAPNSVGPAMVINSAQFNEPVDVDVLSKRIEFALSAGLAF